MNEDFKKTDDSTPQTPETAAAEEQEAEPVKGFALNDESDFFDHAEEALPEQEQKKREKAAKKAARKAAKKASKSRRIGGALLYVSIVLIVCIVLAVGAFMVVRDVLAVSKPVSDLQIEVVVPDNSTTADIAEILAKNKLIDYPIVFRAYMKLNGEDGSLQHGVFDFHPGMSYEEIKILLQEVNEKTAVTVTIPEGKNLSEIADLLVENEVIPDAEAFIEYTNSHFDELVGEHSSWIKSDAARFYQAEGFLFPDTYQFYKKSTNAATAQKMIDHFFAVIDEHQAEIQAGMKKKGLSFTELMSMAAMLQAESGDEQYMADVAGVFYNRLNKASEFPLLQSDPTLTYADEIVKGKALVPVQKTIDSYNTYVCNGLPAGPICSPGEKAILAAATPKTNDYYYFVTDRNGAFYFSKTYAEHQKICWDLGYDEA